MEFELAISDGWLNHYLSGITLFRIWKEYFAESGTLLNSPNHLTFNQNHIFFLVLLTVSIFLSRCPKSVLSLITYIP
jgi:hypothetical protein